LVVRWQSGWRSEREDRGGRKREIEEEEEERGK